LPKNLQFFLIFRQFSAVFVHFSSFFLIFLQFLLKKFNFLSFFTNFLQFLQENQMNKKPEIEKSSIFCNFS